MNSVDYAPNVWNDFLFLASIFSWSCIVVPFLFSQSSSFFHLSASFSTPYSFSFIFLFLMMYTILLLFPLLLLLLLMLMLAILLSLHFLLFLLLLLVFLHLLLFLLFLRLLHLVRYFNSDFLISFRSIFHRYRSTPPNHSCIDRTYTIKKHPFPIIFKIYLNEPPPKSDVSMLSIPLSHIYYINNYSEVRQRLLESPLPLTLLFSSLAHRAR